MRLILPVVLLLTLNCFNKVIIAPFPFGGGADEELVEHIVYGKPHTGCFSRFGSHSKVLVIPIQGVIGADGLLSRGGTDVPQIKRTLDLAADDQDIKAILLLIDSPGGTVTASDQIHKLLSDHSSQFKRPIYAHVDGLGASGAYYIAMASQEINASPSAMVGSIGVILQSFSVRGLLDKVGIEYRSIKTGKNKDMLSPFRDLREDEKDFLQKQLSQVYERFLAHITASRKARLPEDRLRQLADGAVYGAEQSRDSGLIDSVSYVEEYLGQVQKKLSLADVSFVAYLPAGPDYNIYSMRSNAQHVNALSLLELPNRPTVQLYYLWDGGL
ncbi:MAG: signal peptide peptidase SppA [Leptospirales bacterium]|nr:signal peptide peptidase SppA [Leptospirales bacterium]